MKLLLISLMVLLMLLGIAIQWLPGGPSIILLKVVGLVPAFGVLIIFPIWISAACWFVKMAIDRAQKNDYKAVRFYLYTRAWIILPLSRYSEIVRLLRELSNNQKIRPEPASSEFSRFIVKDDFDEYVLTWEGREKMIEKVNDGWITGKFFESPNYLTLLLRIVIIIAIIRLVVALLNILLHFL